MTPHARPWLARADWREGVIRWNGNRRAMSSLRDALGALFARRWATVRTFGDATFTFERVPFLLGEKLEGTLRVRYAGLGADSSLMLGCFPGTYDNDDSLHWRAIHPILLEQVRREGETAVIDVAFNLPADRPPTSLGIMPFTWELSVLKSFPNGYRTALFQVPVFGHEAAPFVHETTIAGSAKRQLRKAMSVFDE